MSKVLYRTLDEQPDVVADGMGCELWMTNGRKMLDMSSSAIYATLGHSNRFVKDAIKHQLFLSPDAFSGMFATAAAERAGETLAEIFDKVKPGWFSKAIFQQGGGEAVDLACKVAAQYVREKGPCRNYVIVRDHCFHGVGLLPFAMSGNYPRYELIDNYHSHVVDSYVMRVPHSIHDMQLSLNSIKNHLSVYEANIMAVVIEPVNGPPTGCHVEEKEYMQEIRRLCDQHDVLLIYDEVLCGSGRCGYLSTAEYYDIWPDITILGKGITSGYQPMSVICLSQKVIDRIASGSRKVMFGTTYSAHPMGCAAVDATLRYMIDRDLFCKTRANSSRWLRDLIHTFTDAPYNFRLRGLGALYGLAILQPLGASYPKAYLDPELEFHAKARKAIADLDVIVYSKGQTVHGQGDFIVIAPPLEIDEHRWHLGLQRIRQGIDKVYMEYVKS